MNRNEIDLNLFVIFDAIYSEGNLTRAGAIVGLSQPAMSNALARLRRACDDPLFVRTPQGMVPTATARRMIGPARQALRLLGDTLNTEARFDAASTSARFRLSMGDLTEARLLPPLLARLDGEAPGVSIESFQVPRREILRELAAGSLDFAIDVPLVDDPGVQHVPLFLDRYVCVVRLDHPEVGEALSLDQFLELRHIHLSSRPRGPGHVDLALERLGHRRRIALRAQHYLMAPVVVARTDLALTVPLGFARDLQRDHPVRILELPFEVPPLESRLYWHGSRDSDPANQWLRARLLDLAGL
jgi:DNA-binding transcriptional LysR family regulator